jgi:uncharacterized OsmC-like protein
MPLQQRLAPYRMANSDLKITLLSTRNSDATHPLDRHRIAKLDDVSEEELHEFIKRGLKNHTIRVEGVDGNPDIFPRILAKRIA